MYSGDSNNILEIRKILVWVLDANQKSDLNRLVLYSLDWLSEVYFTIQKLNKQ